MKTMLRGGVMFLTAFMCAPAAMAAQSYDLIIRNGIVVDGTGREGFPADVLIRGDEIVMIAKAPADSKATRTIDAAGRIVAPGFIDAHSHGQALDKAQAFENFLAMGVTTIVLGQDGSSPDDTSIAAKPPRLKDWFAQLATSPPPVNVATLIGFGSVRRESQAPYDAAASPAQTQAMERLIEQGLTEGAFGVSLGLEYVPMIAASAAELQAVAKAVGRHDGIVMSHMRSEDDDKVAGSIDELLAMGEHARVHVAHIKVVYGKTARDGQAVLDQLSAARARGMKVTADVYPYIASHTGIAIVFPEWAKVQGDFERAKKERRAELAAYLRDRVTKRGGPEATLLSTAPYIGDTLADVARERNTTFVDVLIDDIGPQGASAAYFVMSDAVQDLFIQNPDIMISTDGSPGMFHPRGYGTHARIIESYVMRQKLALPLAVRKMSALTAEALKIGDRGLLREGYKADVVIFDPAKVHGTATWDKPQQLATGFDVVIINGKVTREKEKLTGVRSGRVLRKPN